MNHVTAVLIEGKEALLFVCSVAKDGVITELSREKWNPTDYLNDANGQRLIEEISRRVTSHWKINKSKSDCVVLSLPGTLKDETALISSSRLGIRQPVEISKILSASLVKPCYIFHDTECLIKGEINHGNHFKGEPPLSLVYIFVDEGIGSNISINGKHYLGMGTAGLLGRLIVQPEGPYDTSLMSTGSLEAYSSRPGVSRRLVEVYHSELNKKGSSLLQKDEEYSKFRQALKIASEGDWSQIEYDRIAAGLNSNDPIAVNVIDNAARYLGYSINAVITIINPELIILGGGMIAELPGFSQKVINYARQFCWPTAWNKTEIKASQHGRDMQLFGSIDLALPFLKRKKRLEL
jgi:predicted NBD/HSP70 family sugar kinase